MFAVQPALLTDEHTVTWCSCPTVALTSELSSLNHCHLPYSSSRVFKSLHWSVAMADWAPCWVPAVVCWDPDVVPFPPLPPSQGIQTRCTLGWKDESEPEMGEVLQDPSPAESE